MSKASLKRNIIEQYGNLCQLSGETLSEDTSLFDTHRKNPKRSGGDYSDSNTIVAIPTAHMQEHETLRVRTAPFEKLKSLVDERNKIMQARIKINNQLLAYQRMTDHPSDEMVSFISAQVKVFEAEEGRKLRKIEKHIKSMEDDTPLIKAMLGIRGVGVVTVAYCLVYIDIAKARHASSLWKYVGLHTPSHLRYTKGEAGGGNKTLRTVLYTMADSQIKSRGNYRGVYDNTKQRLERSEKPVETRNRQGKMELKAWKDTMPCHRDGAAKRAVIKHFLADLWMVWRTLEGLETSALYPEAILGGTHRTIMPVERGWVY